MIITYLFTYNYTINKTAYLAYLRSLYLEIL